MSCEVAELDYKDCASHPSKAQLCSQTRSWNQLTAGISTARDIEHAYTKNRVVYSRKHTEEASQRMSQSNVAMGRESS